MPRLPVCLLLYGALAAPAYANQDPANMDAVKTPDPAAVFQSGRSAPAARALPREPMLDLPAGPATLPQMSVTGLPGMLEAPPEPPPSPLGPGPVGPGMQIGMGAAQDAMQLMQQQLLPGASQMRGQMDQIYPRPDEDTRR